VKVSFFQFDIQSEDDATMAADIIKKLGTSTVVNIAAPQFLPNNETIKPDKASMTAVARQLSKEIGTGKPKLTLKQRAQVAAKARWSKKRAEEEKKLKKARSEDPDSYSEVRDPISFDPNSTPPRLGEPNLEELDGREILEQYGG